MKKQATKKKRRNGLFDFLGGKKRKSPTESAYERGLAEGRKAAAAPAPGGGLFNPGKKKTPAKKSAGRPRRRNGLAESLAMGAAAGLASATVQRVLKKKANPAKRRRRGNPVEDAAELASTFYGRPAQSVTEVEEEIHEHVSLTDLGRLIAVSILPFEDKKSAIDVVFERSTTRLCSSENGRQLFIILGESFPIDSIPHVSRSQELIALGFLYSVTYRATKAHLGNESTDWVHEFGDRGEHRPAAKSIAEFPVISYDRLSKRLLIAGGNYSIKGPGIIG
jgi:hypothetical protein